MRKCLCLVALLCSPVWLFASIRTVNMSDAIKGHLIKLNAVNILGAYTGSAVQLILTNNDRKDSLDVTVNLGIILKPEDTAYQPMVLAGEEQLVLAPGKKDEVSVKVFCGNCPRHCPRKNLKYTFLRLGSDDLVHVLRFINNHKLFDYLGQSAVWAITNGNPIGNIYDQERDSVSKQLINIVCSVTGRPKPEYYTVTKQNENPGEAAYNSKPESIVAQFDIVLRNSSILKVGLYDVHGRLLENLVDRRVFSAGGHNLTISFNPQAYGPGNYIIRLSDPERLLKEKRVVVND